ncbi:hypothetical protein NSQ62_08975 [Solibacillus sp. FSL H8-0523]|uniref:hypothetical protein n=1 Tax=Solibacillus sp. FSL H8-0523 TaxID=2954511 RepID=UPI003100EECA
MKICSDFAEIIPIEQEWNGKLHKFDQDSSPKAWEMYSKYYNNFDALKNPSLNKNRLISVATERNINFKVAGDCSFNFNPIKEKCFKSIIGDNQNVLDQLAECCKMHHSLYNFDLMPVTGGLNNMKGKLKYGGKNKIVKVHMSRNAPKNGHLDRLDTYIYFLDFSMSRMKELKDCRDLKMIGEFYNNSIFTFSMNTENFSLLYEIIGNYSSIYSYCETFYNLKDKKFIDKLITNGGKPIETVEDVKNYMDLANEFWRIKKQFLENKGCIS